MDFHGARKYDTLHAVLWTSCLHIRWFAAIKKGSKNDEKKILPVKTGSATPFCKTKNVTGVLTMAAALVAVGPLAADELETVSYVGLTAGPASASESAMRTIAWHCRSIGYPAAMRPSLYLPCPHGTADGLKFHPTTKRRINDREYC